MEDAAQKMVAVACTAVNIGGFSLGRQIAGLVTALKVMGIVGLIVAGLAFVRTPVAVDWSWPELGWDSLSPMLLGLVGVYWSYGARGPGPEHAVRRQLERMVQRSQPACGQRLNPSERGRRTPALMRVKPGHQQGATLEPARHSNPNDASRIALKAGRVAQTQEDTPCTSASWFRPTDPKSPTRP